MSRAPGGGPVALADVATLLEQGSVDAAEHLVRRLLAAAPTDPATLHLAGLCAFRLGNWLVAIGRFEAALRRRRKDGDLWAALGLAHLEAGNSDDAVHALRRAAVPAPSSADMHCHLGDALCASGRPHDARQAYVRAVTLTPGHRRARHNLGVCLRTLGRLEEAAEAFAVASRGEGAGVASLVNLGNVLEELGRLEDAREALRAAAATPRAPLAAHLALGNVSLALRAYDEAELAYRSAHALDPHDARVLANLGCLHRLRGETALALRYLDEAIAQSPADPQARLNRALVLLSAGRLRDGWADYAWRVQARNGDAYLADPFSPGKALPRPRSHGNESFAGKRLLLLSDQGLGDDLFFLRFAPLAMAQGAHVAFHVPAKLATLIERAQRVNAVSTEVAPEGERYDAVLATGDLPLLLGCGDDCIPPAPRISPTRETTTRAAALLGDAGPDRVIGVTWRAGGARRTGELGSLKKLVDPAALGALLASWPGKVVILQRQPDGEEANAFLQALGRPAVDASAANEDLELMLALLSLVDEYVCVSNTNVHLRDALHRGSRVLVPHPPEWRWGASGSVSPWFPASRVYRQDADGEWRNAFAELRRDLRLE